VTFNSYRYRYRGKLRLLGHNVFITMRGLNHDGYMYCIFKEPLGHFDVLTGVFAAITTNRLPVAGRMLLRRVHGMDAANVVPAFLAATEVSATAKALLHNDSGDLVIVPDLPIWQYRELEEGGAEWKQPKSRITKKTK
jgi:hypothetical protein